jgi:hypothetical protein
MYSTVNLLLMYTPVQMTDYTNHIDIRQEAITPEAQNSSSLKFTINYISNALGQQGQPQPLPQLSDRNEKNDR